MPLSHHGRDDLQTPEPRPKTAKTKNGKVMKKASEAIPGRKYKEKHVEAEKKKCSHIRQDTINRRSYRYYQPTADHLDTTVCLPL